MLHARGENFSMATKAPPADAYATVHGRPSKPIVTRVPTHSGLDRGFLSGAALQKLGPMFIHIRGAHHDGIGSEAKLSSIVVRTQGKISEPLTWLVLGIPGSQNGREKPCTN